jgi:hypothetical protein
MVRRPRIKNRIRGLILEIYQSDKDLTAKEIQKELARQLVKSSGNTPIPSERAIQNIIHEWEHPKTPQKKEARERFDELLQIWHLGLLPRYPQFDAQAVKRILEVQIWADERGLYFPIFTRDGLTVRQALWIARLHAIVDKDTQGSNERLWQVSYFYALEELASELAGQSFFSLPIDQALREGKLYFDWRAVPVTDRNLFQDAELLLRHIQKGENGNAR